MLTKRILSAVVASAVTLGTIGTLHAQEASTPGTYVYRAQVKGLIATAPTCVEGVASQTQVATCPVGQTVDGTIDGATTFTQSYEVTTACPSGEYGAPVATPSAASPTVEEACAEPDPWSAFLKDLGVATPSSWSQGFSLPNKGVSALPAAPYPATSVSGAIVLSDNHLTNLDGLSSLQLVTGDLILDRNALTNVNGLSNLQSVTGYLVMSSNKLTNVDGLSSLQSVGYFMNLHGNGLTNVDGLSRLQSVGSSLDLGANQLTNVDGLSSLWGVGDVLELRSNRLTNVNGLSNLRHVGYILYLDKNPELTDLSGLSGLQTGLPRGAYFDAGIHLRDGFVPIQGGALCAKENAAKFPAGYATQDQVCASVH